MDPEAPLHKELLSKIAPFFQVWEEVSLAAKNGGIVRADLLFIEDKFNFPFAVAIEIKSKQPKQPKNYRDTFLQALNYIGADRIDERVPAYPVKFAMVFQRRDRWSLNINNVEFINQNIIDSIQMDALELAFNSFCVGHIVHDNNELSLRLCHNKLWSSRKGWSEELRRRIPGLATPST